MSHPVQKSAKKNYIKESSFTPKALIRVRTSLLLGCPEHTFVVFISNNNAFIAFGSDPHFVTVQVIMCKTTNNPDEICDCDSEQAGLLGLQSTAGYSTMSATTLGAHQHSSNLATPVYRMDAVLDGRPLCSQEGVAALKQLSSTTSGGGGLPLSAGTMSFRQIPDKRQVKQQAAATTAIAAQLGRHASTLW